LKRSTLTVLILFCVLEGTSFSHAGPTLKVTDYSLPKESGPGIVICDPVATPASSDRSHFGAGCALWLQFYLGGLPELGKSPTWDGLIRARAELHRDDLQLSTAQATTLIPILGITNVAVGTLSGTGLHLTLTYTLLQEPGGKIVGASTTVTGTRLQITARLPEIARTLAAKLDVPHPDIPTTTGLTPSDLLLLDKVRHSAHTDLAASDQKALDALAMHNPLAGFMALKYEDQTNSARNATVTTLLEQVGTNTLVWSTAASINSMTILPHAEALTTLATRYPGNANIAVAETFRYRYVADPIAEQKAAARIVQDAPNNPDGWLTYAFTFAKVADNLRQGRYFPNLTADEFAQLKQIYPQWEDATQQAVRLDPLDGKGWHHLAESASFNGHPIVAENALQNALKYDDDKLNVYSWALEMYQPKWLDNPIKLAKFAKMAAADTSFDAPQALLISRTLIESGNQDLAKSVISAFYARSRAFIARHPNDGSAHAGLAYMLEETGDATSAIAEYRKASSLLPDNPVIHFNLGHALYRPGGYDEAGKEYQKAIRLDPDYADAHSSLAYLYRHFGKFEDAKREVKTALRLNPGDGLLYALVGDIDTLQKNYTDAVKNYRTAIQYGAYQVQIYDFLVWCLDHAELYDQTITADEDALRTYPNGDFWIFSSMADAYLKTKQWDKSIAICQTALSQNPNDANAYENLGEAYLGKGDKAKAREQWQKVLTLNDEALKAKAQKFLDQNP